MIKIRIEGTAEEIQQVIKDFSEDDNVLSISRFYPNRGMSKFGRIYIDYEY